MIIPDLYNEIRDHVMVVPYLQEFRLYNSEIQQLDGLDIVNMPAVCLEWQQITYDEEVQRQVSGQANISLHILVSVIDNHDTSYLQIAEDIKSALIPLRKIKVTGQVISQNHNNIVDVQVLIWTNQLDLNIWQGNEATPEFVIDFLGLADITGPYCDNVWANTNQDHLIQCIIPRIPFETNSDYFDALTDSQKEFIADNYMLNFYKQSPFDYGNISGAFVIDWDQEHSWLQAVLTGNITFGYTNFEPNSNVYFELAFTQDSIGGHTIDFQGSGVWFLDGFDGASMQPNPDSNSVTSYSCKWQLGRLTIIKAQTGTQQ